MKFNMISRDKIYEVSSINSKLEATLIKSEYLNYIKISNFLRYPEEFINVFSQYPALTGPSYVTIPGARQNFTPIELKNILLAYQVILGKFDIKTDPRQWISSTNIMWDGMLCQKGSNKPHCDVYGMVANLWLSNHKGGTAFYKFRGKFKESDLSEDEYKIYLHTQKGTEKWYNFEGDSNWEKYHLIPTEYNTVYIYDGGFFHSPYPELTNEYRYSLTSFYHQNLQFT